MSNKPPFSADYGVRQRLNAQVWRLTGKMMGGNLLLRFSGNRPRQRRQGQNHPILDMTRVVLANSTGIGVLASIFNAAKDAGGAMTWSGSTTGSSPS